MKKTFTLFLLLAGFTFAASAQQNDRFKINVGLEGGLPINSTSYTASAGLFLKAELPVSKNLALTANVTYSKFFFSDTLKTLHEFNGDRETSATFIPVLVGARYYLPSGFYGEAQIGASFGSKSSEGTGGDLYPDTGTAFAFTPGVGYALKLKNGEAVDFGVRYEAWHKTIATLDFVSLRVAYKFNW